MSDITGITFFLDIPRFDRYLAIIIYWAYCTCMYDQNVHFFIGKAFSYVISLLLIILKQSTKVIQGTRSPPNSKYHLPHTRSKFYLLCISIDFFSLGQFYSLSQYLQFCFIAGSSSYWSSFWLVTGAVPFSAEISAPDYKGFNTSNPTTKFYWTVTPIWFLLYSCPSDLFSLGQFSYLSHYFLFFKFLVPIHIGTRSYW